MRKFLLGILVVILVFAFALIYNLWKLAPNPSKHYSSYTFRASKNKTLKVIDSLVEHDTLIGRVTIDNSTTNFYNTGRFFTIRMYDVDYFFRFKGDSLHWIKSEDNTEFYLTSIDTYKKNKKSTEEYLEMIEVNFIKKGSIP